MALRTTCDTVTFVAAADLSDKQYTYVYQSAANACSAAGDTQNGVGYNVYILQNKPASGELAECAVLGTGQSLLKVVDSSASIGTQLMISTGGLGTARVGANKYAIAQIDEAVTATLQIVAVDTTKPILVST